MTVTEPEGYAHKCEVLERHCEAVDRDPATIARSMMLFPLAALNEAALEGVARKTMAHFGAGPGDSPRAFRERMEGRGLLSGTTEQVVEKLGRLASRRWSSSTWTSTQTRCPSTSPPRSPRASLISSR